jgi:hypothetical protein
MEPIGDVGAFGSRNDNHGNGILVGEVAVWQQLLPPGSHVLSLVVSPVLESGRCLSSAVDGSQVALLTGSAVHIFDTSQCSLSCPTLEAVNSYPLGRDTWTGVAIAGSYLAVWGESTMSGQSLVGGKDYVVSTWGRYTIKKCY